MAATNIINKPFVKGECVKHYVGEYRSDVFVTDVNGDIVSVADSNGHSKGKFSPRASDGMFVLVGSPDFEVMPTMIYHRKETTEATESTSIFRKIAGFFK